MGYSHFMETLTMYCEQTLPLDRIDTLGFNFVARLDLATVNAFTALVCRLDATMQLNVDYCHGKATISTRHGGKRLAWLRGLACGFAAGRDCK